MGLSRVLQAGISPVNTYDSLMILTWNVWGLNKGARHVEIGSYLKQMKYACIALLETRVKKENLYYL